MKVFGKSAPAQLPTGEGHEPPVVGGSPAVVQKKPWGPTEKTRGATQVVPGSQGDEVICPVLRALVKEGRVPMAADGTVKLDDLRAAIKDAGGTPGLGHASWGIGAIGNQPGDIWSNLKGGTFNLKELPQGIVPHPADSGVLRGGKFDEAAFQRLTAHAENGVMTTSSFAGAIAESYRRDLRPGNVIDSTVRGLNFAQLEFAGLLSVFGREDPATGKTGIAVCDLRQLYENGTIPPGMQGGRSSIVETLALQASLKVKTDASLASHAFGSVLTATGLSRAGARLTEGQAETRAAAAQASNGAGKAAGCPYMTGAAKMPSVPADVVNAHTAAGIQQPN